MVKQEILDIIKPKKTFEGFSKDENGNKVPITLYWFDNGYRTIDYLKPIAFRMKIESEV